MLNNNVRKKRKKKRHWRKQRRRTWRRRLTWNLQRWQTESYKQQKHWSEWWIKTFSMTYLKVGALLRSFLQWNFIYVVSRGRIFPFNCYLDYRYWDDPSDEFKDGEGSLLPLWKFSYEKTKKHDITDMCFNSRYYDLFAVAFGTR